MSSAGAGASEMRIHKYLSRAGAASRREAERWILQGRVRLNGVVVRDLASRMRVGVDRVEVDGRTVEVPAPKWILLHKPRGILTSRGDPHGRRTVYDLLPPRYGSIPYLGRLDMNTEGLLLFTNEGGVANRLAHPSGGVEREYQAWVEGVPDRAAIRALTEGVLLEDGPARAVSARVLRTTRSGAVVSLVLTEGRKREVRRLLEAVGHRVGRLIRTRFGPVRLGTLPAGAWRELEPSEIGALRRLARSEEDT